MKTTSKIFILGLVMVMALCYTNSANAESNFATGAAAQSGGAGAAVNLDFQIVIPAFIYFRVGSDLAAIDQIQFAPTADEVATAATTAGTGGDLGNGTVTVSIVSNAGLGAGVVVIETNNSGGNGLYDGVANYISYAQIITATNNGNLPAPILSNGASNSVNIAATAGAITNRQAQWTYTYNSPVTPPAAGTYGGLANGGRVTYTAATP